jgi:hypothetical protein
MEDSIRRVITISAGSSLGSIILITIIDYIPRKKLLAWSFLGLAIWFAIAGGCLFDPARVDSQPLKVAVYIVYRILCNLGKFFVYLFSHASTNLSVIIGPNTLLFIVSCIQYHDS